MNDQQSNIYKHSMKLERRTASLYVQNTGCQQCPPSYGWGPGVRNHFLLHHVVRGRGVYICRDQRYELSAGDTFLIYPDTTIHYFADAADPWEYVWAGFGGLDAESCVERTDFTPDEPVFYGRDSAQIAQLVQAVYSAYGTSSWEELEMTARLYSLLAFLVRTAQRRQSQSRESLDCAQLAAEYIINHYEEPITVEGLAAYASVSHSAASSSASRSPPSAFCWSTALSGPAPCSRLPTARSRRSPTPWALTTPSTSPVPSRRSRASPPGSTPTRPGESSLERPRRSNCQSAQNYLRGLYKKDSVKWDKTYEFVE